MSIDLTGDFGAAGGPSTERLRHRLVDNPEAGRDAGAQPGVVVLERYDDVRPKSEESQGWNAEVIRSRPRRAFHPREEPVQRARTGPRCRLDQVRRCGG
jgi:hypothetical protein